LIYLKRIKDASSEVYQFEKVLPQGHQQKNTLKEMRASINQQSSLAGFRPASKNTGQRKKSKKSR
ncbi:MAG: calcineurin-like phosphoesterase family protein, partial [Phenylobacterium sp.]